MKTFTSLINESKKTTSNKERRAQLEQWLKDKKYHDYVGTLEKMMKDPKAKTLLQDGFGGDLGNIKFEFQPRLIKASMLTPTQKEIDIEKSLKYALTNVESIKKDFDREVIVGNAPIVTFKGTYIIDGHHRWVEVAAINPEGQMMCLDYDADISPTQMLKAVQGTIAAVLSKEGKKELPHHDVKSKNIYDSDLTVGKIRKYVAETMTDAVMQELCRHYPSCDGKDTVVKIVTDNIVRIKVDNRPMKHSHKRIDMPQPVKDKDNNKDDDETALDILKDGKFVRTAL